jgi:hypothetical protein
MGFGVGFKHRTKVTAMLMVECPDCKEWIPSPFLLEIKETQCPNCEGLVPVKEVYISAGAYSINRDALLKSIFKYKRLIAEAGKNLEELQKNKRGAYEVKRVVKFIENLKELLDGCRDSPRAPGGRVMVECTFKDAACNSELVNISSTGACVDVGEVSFLPQKGDKVGLRFWGKDPFRVEGSVIWIGKENRIGTKFLNIDKLTIKHLHDYILEKIPELWIEKKTP